MALSVSQTKALAGVIKPGMKIASMGYPDIIAKIEMEGLEYREDSEAICRRHGLQPRQIPDAHSYFNIQGCGLDVYDIVKERGCEILCDLNEPLETGLSYDIVLDVGTVEHCFNISQAIKNMAGLVKEGGYIIHENPFNWANHGFYNLNPTFFWDFYRENGFDVMECCLTTKAGEKAQVPLTQRFKFTEMEVNIFTMARRTKVQDFVFPMQSKYKPAAGVRAEVKETVNG